MECIYCKDQAEVFDGKQQPVCADCFLEKECDIVVNHNIALPPSRPSQSDEEPPGWHNVVRALEDWLSIG